MTGAMAAPSVQIGDRPYWLVNEMEDSPLKQELGKCTVVVAARKRTSSPRHVSHSDTF